MLLSKIQDNSKSELGIIWNKNSSFSLYNALEFFISLKWLMLKVRLGFLSPIRYKLLVCTFFSHHTYNLHSNNTSLVSFKRKVKLIMSLPLYEKTVIIQLKFSHKVDLILIRITQ